MCCTWFAHDCTRVTLSVHAGDSSRSSEEIVENISKCIFESNYYYYYYYYCYYYHHHRHHHHCSRRRCCCCCYYHHHHHYHHHYHHHLSGFFHPNCLPSRPSVGHVGHRSRRPSEAEEWTGPVADFSLMQSVLWWFDLPLFRHWL